MSQHELNWGEVKGGDSQEQTPFLKLQNGENRVRIIGRPSLIDIHWEKSLDDQPKKIICPGHGCPICKVGHAPQSRYQVQVIDRTDNKVKVLEGGVTIFNQIKSYAMDPDYGDPTKYDVKIRKEGNGRETKYTIIAAPRPSELKSEEKEMVANAKKLSDINKVKTIEEIMQMGLSVLADSIADLDDFDNTDNNPVGKDLTADLAADEDDWDQI